jgi:serine/threonine-protein kinase HipA
LPEGRRLTAVRRVLKTAADDDLSMLLAVGGDLVGDVEVSPPDGDAGTLAEVSTRVGGFDQISFAEVLEGTLGPTGLAASGIPGIQDKVCSARITLPHGRDYILKLSPPEFPFLVENEAFFLAAARTSGLRVVDAELVRNREGTAGLQVVRFDRAAGTRLAAEDACQVLDVYPVRKYGRTATDVVQALAQRCQARPVAARDLYAQMVFAYLSGNGEAHAKNFSIVQEATGEWRIAPAHDLPSTFPYGDTTIALAIDGRTSDLTRARMLPYAHAIGLSQRAAIRILDDLTSSADIWLDRLDELPFDSRRIHELRRFLRYRQREIRG